MGQFKVMVVVLFTTFLISCGHPQLNSEAQLPSDYTYIIGPGDMLDIFVWDNPDVSKSIVVRPDGKISAPLIDDVLAIGKTPSELARELEKGLSEYIVNPLVAVIVNEFEGIYQQQVRVVGQINSNSNGSSSGSRNSRNRYTAKSLPYRKGMTLLDLMVQVGGIGQFGDGNRSSIIRKMGDKQQQFGVRIDDLLEDGDLTANVQIQPGDILIIPESFF